MMLGPMLIYFFMVLIESFVLNSWVETYVKPLRFCASAIYIPNWLWEREVIIPQCNVKSVDIGYYELWTREGTIYLFSKIRIFTSNNENYELDMGDSTFGYFGQRGVLNLNIPEYDVRFIELNTTVFEQIFRSKVHKIMFPSALFFTAASFINLLY